MAIKKTYVSDLSGDEIDGKPIILTLGRYVTKKSSYYSSRTYRDFETKKLHLTKEESEAVFNKEIREWLGFEPAPAPDEDE